MSISAEIVQTSSVQEVATHTQISQNNDEVDRAKKAAEEQQMRLEMEKKELEMKQEQQRIEQMKREQEMKEQQLREQQQREQEQLEQQRREQLQREQEALEQQRREQERQEEELRQHQLMEQQKREQEAREQQLREQQMREQQMREEQQRQEQQLREQQVREQQMKEQQMREQQMREQQMREQQMREQQMQQQQMQMQQQQMQQQQFEQQQMSMSRTTTETSSFSQQQNLQQSNLSMQVKSGGFMTGQQGGQQQVEDYTSSLKPTSEGELIRTHGDLQYTQSSVQQHGMEQVKLRSTGGAKDIKDNIRQSGVFVGVMGDLNALVADGNEKHSVQDIVKHFSKIKPGDMPQQMMPQHYQMQHAPPSLSELQEQAKDKQFSYQKKDQVDGSSELSLAEQRAAEEKAKLFERRTSLKEYLLMDGEKTQQGINIIDPSNILQGAKASRWQSDSPFESRFSLRGMSSSPTMQMQRPIAPKPFVKSNTDYANKRPLLITRQPEQHHPKHLQKLTRPDSAPISKPPTQTQQQITEHSNQTQQQQTVFQQEQVMYTKQNHKEVNVLNETNDQNLAILLQEEQLELQRQQKLHQEYEEFKQAKEKELREQEIRQQKLQEKQMQEQQLREEQLRQQQIMEQQVKEKEAQEIQLREQQMREQQMREQQMRVQQEKERKIREQQLKEQQEREQKIQEQQMREKQIQEQQLREQQMLEQQMREQQQRQEEERRQQIERQKMQDLELQRQRQEQQRQELAWKREKDEQEIKRQMEHQKQLEMEKERQMQMQRAEEKEIARKEKKKQEELRRQREIDAKRKQEEIRLAKEEELKRQRRVQFEKEALALERQKEEIEKRQQELLRQQEELKNLMRMEQEHKELLEKKRKEIEQEQADKEIQLISVEVQKSESKRSFYGDDNSDSSDDTYFVTQTQLCYRPSPLTITTPIPTPGSTPIPSSLPIISEQDSSNTLPRPSSSAGQMMNESSMSLPAMQEYRSASSQNNSISTFQKTSELQHQYQQNISYSSNRTSSALAHSITPSSTPVPPSPIPEWQPLSVGGKLIRAHQLDDIPRQDTRIGGQMMGTPTQGEMLNTKTFDYSSTAEKSSFYSTTSQQFLTQPPYNVEPSQSVSAFMIPFKENHWAQGNL